MEHKIISLSVESELLQKIEQVRVLHNFQRSEFWRKAAIAFMSELDEDEFTGRVQGVLTVVHQEKDEVITKHKHTFTHVIQTHLHTHLEKEHSCLEVFILDGDGQKIKELLKTMRRAKGVLSVKLALA